MRASAVARTRATPTCPSAAKRQIASAPADAGARASSKQTTRTAAYRRPLQLETAQRPLGSRGQAASADRR
eukprot:5230684-Prymnesium_polylepis.1